MRVKPLLTDARRARPARLAVLLLTCTLVFPWRPVVADSDEQFVVVSNDEVVGTLVVSSEGAVVEIVYRVDNNGRGPKIDERIELDGRGYPTSWSIEGSSLFGAPVRESYRWSDGAARWISQAEQGTRPSTVAPMYIGGDASPWAYGMYVRALLQASDRAMEVLPSGRMVLKQLDTMEFGSDRLPVTIYEISGIQLEPQLIALDAAGQLFARPQDSGGLVRKGFESSLAQLNEWARAYELRRLQGMQQQLAHNYDLPLRYRNVRIFDPWTRTTGEPVSLLVRDGLVASIEADPMAGDPEAEAIVDGEGGTLVAGLYDMHSHSSMESGLFYLAAGVTSTRDMGNDNELLAEIRLAIDAGDLAGPRITPDGMIEARSPYSVRMGIVADSLDEALEAARWYAAHGYREIKIYNSMQPEWLVPLAAEAKALGLGVTGHVPAFVTPDQAILAGYDSIAHINQLMLGWLLEPGEDTRTPLRLTAMKRAANLDLADPRVSNTVALMREHGTSLDTTAVILERLMLSRAGEVQPGDLPYLDHMPIGYQRYRSRTFVPLDEPGDDDAYRQGFQSLLKVIKLLYDNGIPLLVGTDDGTGFTVHRELELYAAAGIPPADALAMATLGSAKYLGLEDRSGSIEPGKHADFFLLPGDPAEDISRVRQIRLVSRGGTIYFPDEIYRELGIEPFAAAAAVQAPEPPPHPWFAPTRVDDTPLIPVVRTSHRGRYNGSDIEFDVIAGELLLNGADGEPAATMFSTAYVRTDAGANRPVLFLFNGGPGASSSPLHLGVGPVRRPSAENGDDPDGALLPNPPSPIDALDMVFVDPVGTGFTRLLRDDAGEQFWGIEQDADSVLLLMREWLERNDRLDSPVFLMGESYGGTRAVVVAARAADVDIDGILLLSPALDFSAGSEVIGNNLPFMATLPSMAATAAYHGVTDSRGRNYLEIFDAAARYALSDYAAALYQGNTIAPEEKSAVARDMADLIGLSPEYILEANLRIDRAEFGDRLLGNEGMRVGRLDTRAKGPLAEYKDLRPPRDDPSMSGRGQGGRSTGELLQEYFNGPLGVAIDRPYRTLNLDLNQKWDYGNKGALKTYFSVAPDLQQAMNSNPDLRVWIGGGIFDLGTPIMAARYTASQIDADPNRFVLSGFEGGHATFEHEESRIAICDDIRAFVRPSAEP